MERRSQSIATKEMLLAIGDRYEDEIAADRAASDGALRRRITFGLDSLQRRV